MPVLGLWVEVLHLSVLWKSQQNVRWENSWPTVALWWRKHPQCRRPFSSPTALVRTGSPFRKNYCFKGGIKVRLLYSFWKVPNWPSWPSMLPCFQKLLLYVRKLCYLTTIWFLVNDNSAGIFQGMVKFLILLLFMSTRKLLKDQGGFPESSRNE